MKKENTSSIFLSVITVILLICAILLLMIAGLSFISAPKNQNAYDFIKDHGSFAAGILGFIGIFILVWSQSQSTKKTVSATLEAIKAESREIEWRNDKQCILNIIIGSDNLTSISQSDLKNFTYEHCYSYLQSIKENSQELVFANLIKGKNIIFFIESCNLFFQDLLKYQSGIISTSENEYIEHLERLRKTTLNFLENITAECCESSTLLEVNRKIQEHLEGISFNLYPEGHLEAQLLSSDVLHSLHIILSQYNIYAVWLLKVNRNIR